MTVPPQPPKPAPSEGTPAGPPMAPPYYVPAQQPHADLGDPLVTPHGAGIGGWFTRVLGALRRD